MIRAKGAGRVDNATLCFLLVKKDHVAVDANPRAEAQ